MKSLKRVFGRRLKAARKAKGMTQEALGQAVGIDYKHLGAIERGVKAPSFDLVEKLAKVLRVEHYRFFLPEQSEHVDVEAELRAVMGEMSRSRRAAIRDFLTQVLRTLKKLDVG